MRPESSAQEIQQAIQSDDRYFGCCVNKYGDCGMMVRVVRNVQNILFIREYSHAPLELRQKIGEQEAQIALLENETRIAALKKKLEAAAASSDEK